MQKKVMNTLVLGILSFGLICSGVLAQEKLMDRRQYIDPEKTTTTDDPRRIPVPPGMFGAKGDLVIVGGRIFDGTGQAVKEGTHAVPTLVPYIYIFDLAGGYYGSTSRRFTFSKEDNLGVLRRMKEAGIKMGIGTDLVVNWFRYLPKAFITELKQFVKVGYSIPEVLMTATKTNAEIFWIWMISSARLNRENWPMSLLWMESLIKIWMT